MSRTSERSHGQAKWRGRPVRTFRSRGSLRRIGRHNRRARSPARALHVEWLESRRVLSGNVPPIDTQVDPSWFGAVADSASGELVSAPARTDDGDRWIVRLAAESSESINSATDAVPLLRQGGVPIEVLRGLGLPGQLLVETTGLDDDAVTAILSANPHVAYFERDVPIQGGVIPDDLGFSVLSGLNNLGQSGGSVDADIDAPEAWDITTGSDDLVVAVIDSGIDYTHVDLAANIWTNPGESGPDGRGGDKATNGQDDDGNGFVDDVHGYDFRNNDGDPLDDHRHGTHVAGTIGAVGNNGEGVTGVNWTTSMMALKFLDEHNIGATSDAIQAVNYATMMREKYGINVRVLNASWGMPGAFNQGLRDAIEAAGEADMLFVTAAGNGDVFGRGQDNDELPFFPASYDLNNIIAVAATDHSDKLARFSNYGEISVDLAAPGVGIWSTELGGQYGSRNGTSMAVPHVSGVAALVWSHIADAHVDEVRAAILQGVDPEASLANRVATGGRLNAFGALLVDTFAPKATLVAAADITIANTESQLITVDWTDNVTLDILSVSDGDLLVRNLTSGATYLPTLQSVDVVEDGPLRTAFYEMAAPGGMWDVFDAAEYQLELTDAAVSDFAGNDSRTAVIGTFTVDITVNGVFRPSVFFDAADANLDDNEADDGVGNATLRAAVQEANLISGPAAVILTAGTYTFGLAGTDEDNSLTGDLDITGEVTITTDGTGEVIIDAAGIDRVFDVQTGGSLTLEGVTLTGGDSKGQEGGGVRNNGALTVDRATICGNTTDQDGGGIANDGGLTIDNSTISGNSAESGGGLWNDGTATITNSTFSGNLAEAQGGGIYNTEDGSVDLLNSTVTENSAGGVGTNGLLIADTTQFRANTTVTGPQTVPTVDVDSAGNLVVVWQSGTGTSTEIRARRYGPDGTALADDSLVMHNTTGSFTPDVAIDSQGRYTITYAAEGYDSSGLGIAARRYGSDGTLLDTPPCVNGPPNPIELYNQIRPSVAISDLTGRITVVYDQSNSNANVRMRWYEADFSLASTNQFLANAGSPTGTQHQNDTAFLSNGNAVVVWYDNVMDGSGRGVFAQLFDGVNGIGNNVTPAIFGIPSTVQYDQHHPAVATTSNGFVVAWQSRHVNGSTFDIFARRFDNLGNPLGNEFMVNAGSSLDEYRPAIAANSAGDFVIAWTQSSDDESEVGDEQVLARSFSWNGTPRQDEFVVASNGLSGQQLPQVAMDTQGNVVIVWEGTSAGDLEEISARLYTNTFFNGGGVANAEGGAVSLRNTIVAANTSDDSGPDVTGDFNSQGGNLIGDVGIATGLVDGVSSDQVGDSDAPIDPLLGPLQDNGGPTDTHKPMTGSPVIDAGIDAGAPVVDQRGIPRPVDGDGDSTATTDIGAVEAFYVELRGRIFHDHDSNGIQDTSDEGLAGWTLFLDVDGNGQLDTGEPTTLTTGDDPLTTGIDESGDYRFTQLTPDTYTVLEVLQSGWEQSGVPSMPVTLQPSEMLLNLDFANRAFPGEIRGHVFRDTDGDGFQDAGEVGLEAWTIYLDLDESDDLSPGDIEAQTDDNGDYIFTSITPLITHAVRADVPELWIPTLPSAADGREWTIPVGAGESFTGIDFGAFFTAGSSSGELTGRVFEDTNGNGVQDPGEPGIAGRTVYLDIDDNGQYDANIDSGVTTSIDSPFTPTIDESGFYQFNGLGEFNFVVRVVAAADEKVTSPVGNALSPTEFDTRENTAGMVAADFDGQNGIDLAAVNSSTNDISILLNDGSGLFSSLDSIPVNQGPSSIAVGHFNQDAHPDLAVSHFASATVAILLGDGQGGFTRAANVTVPVGFSAITVADFDGNGFDDLAVAIDSTNAVTILINDGSGAATFTTAPHVSVGNAPLAITAARINADAFPDLVVGNYVDNTVQVLTNNGDNTFVAQSPIPVGTGPSAIAASDINGDTHNDILVTNISSNDVTLLLSSGPGVFQPAVSLPAGIGPRDVKAADLEGDGDLDIIVGNLTSSDVTLLRNDGTGTFSLPETTGLGVFAGLEPLGVKSIVAEDLTGDGLVDIAAAKSDFFNGSVTVLANALTGGSHRIEGDGQNTVSVLHFGIHEETPPIPGDFDADGDVDGEDLGIWEGGFGTTTGADPSDGDTDDDSDVDGDDFLSWQRNLTSPSVSAIASSTPTATIVSGQNLQAWWDSSRSREPGPLREIAKDMVMREFALDESEPIQPTGMYAAVVELRPARHVGPRQLYQKDVYEASLRERVLDLSLADYLDGEL